MKPFYNKTGITIKQLKELVKDLPETDENGEDFEVWLEDFHDHTLSSIATSIMQLNKGDIIIANK